MHTPLRGPLAVISHLYPQRGREECGIFVSEQVRALTAMGIEVDPLVVPVPWTPWPLPLLRHKWARYAQADRQRTDFGSVDVLLPRYLSFPRKLLRRLSAHSAVLSLSMSGAHSLFARAPAAIVAHTALLDGRVARALSKRLGVPYVVVIHGEDLYQNIRGRDAWRLAGAVRSVLSDASGVIAVSQPVAEGIAEAFPELPPAYVLPNGVDVGMFKPVEQHSNRLVGPSGPPNGPLRILSASHLAERKAHRYVLEAVAQLAHAGVSIRYTIAGDGPERGRLEAEVERLGIAESVRMLGAYRLDELPALMNGADLFVLPAWDEAFGVVYLEALACGLPAVAAKAGGACTIIDNGVDGYLIAPRNAEEIADAIRTFLTLDPVRRRAMSAAARRKAQGYTWEANARGLVGILGDLADRAEADARRTRGERHIASGASTRLEYRFDEVRRAARQGGIAGAAQAMSSRLLSDAHGASRRLYARAIARDGIVVLPIQGSSMALHLDDPGISRGLIRDGIREREHTQLIHEEVGPGMVGVDLGANLGYYALMEAKLVGPGGRVIAIEPVPRNAETLRQNVMRNGYAHVDVHEIAVSDECCEVGMWVPPQSNFCNLLSEDDEAIKPRIRRTHASEESASRISVPALTLDAFLNQQAIGRVDFIRMDIEGHEIRATNGMRRTFEAASHPLRLIVEVHNNHFVDPCATVVPWLRGLLDMGFRPKALAVRDHPQGMLRNLSPSSFPELVCSFADSCPHLLLVKNG